MRSKIPSLWRLVAPLAVSLTLAGCIDDDTIIFDPRPFVAAIQPDSVHVAEGGSYNLTVIINRPLIDSAVVTLTSSNPAKLYVPTSATIPRNKNQITFTLVSIHDADTDDEVLTITALTNNFQATAKVTVTDDDSPPVTPPPPPPLALEITPERLHLIEGGRTRDFTLLLNQAASADLPVSLRQLGGSAGDLRFFEVGGLVPVTQVIIPQGATSVDVVVAPRFADADSSGAYVLIEADGGSVASTAEVEIFDEGMGFGAGGLFAGSRPALLPDGSLLWGAENAAGDGSAGFSTATPGRLFQATALSIPLVAARSLTGDAGTFSEGPEGQVFVFGLSSAGYLSAASSSGTDGSLGSGSDRMWLGLDVSPQAAPSQTAVALSSLEPGVGAQVVDAGGGFLAARTRLSGSNDSAAVSIVSALAAIPSASHVFLDQAIEPAHRLRVARPGLILAVAGESSAVFVVSGSSLLSKIPATPDSLVVLAPPAPLGPDRAFLILRRVGSGDTVFAAVADNLDGAATLALIPTGQTAATEGSGTFPLAVPGAWPVTLGPNLAACVLTGPDGAPGTLDDQVAVFSNLTAAGGSVSFVDIGASLARPGVAGGRPLFLSSERLVVPTAGLSATSLESQDNGFIVIQNLLTTADTLYMGGVPLDSTELSTPIALRETAAAIASRTALGGDPAIAVAYDLDGTGQWALLEAKDFAPGHGGRPVVIRSDLMAYASAEGSVDGDRRIRLAALPVAAGEAEVAILDASLSPRGSGVYDLSIFGHQLHALDLSNISLVSNRTVSITSATLDSGLGESGDVPRIVLTLQISPTTAGSMTLDVELSTPVGTAERGFTLTIP